MNKFLKVVIAILGACNAIFSMFIPVSIVLLLISLVDISAANKVFLWSAGIASTLYRAINIGFMRD